MAKKVICGSCGAKNKADLDRCRLCGTPFDKADDEVARAPEPELDEVAAEFVEAEIERQNAVVSGDVPAGHEVDISGAVQLYATTNPGQVFPEEPDFDRDTLEIEEQAPLVPRGEFIVEGTEDLTFDYDDVEVDIERREQVKLEGPPVLSNEDFDVDGLEVEEQVVHDAAPVLDPNYKGFDPAALVVEDPSDPAPS